jgi:SOS-response transcriptional repressor LexA
VTETLTARQAEVLAFIEKNAKVVGPTFREIMDAFGIASPNGVACHVKALEKKGAVKSDGGHVAPRDPRVALRLAKKALLNNGFDPEAIGLAAAIGDYLGSTEP